MTLIIRSELYVFVRHIDCHGSFCIRKVEKKIHLEALKETVPVPKHRDEKQVGCVIIHSLTQSFSSIDFSH